MLSDQNSILIVDILLYWYYLSGVVDFIVKIGVKIAKVGLVLMLYSSGLFKWDKTLKHSAYKLKLFIKSGVIYVLLFAKFRDNLLCN